MFIIIMVHILDAGSGFIFQLSLSLPASSPETQLHVSCFPNWYQSRSIVPCFHVSRLRAGPTRHPALYNARITSVWHYCHKLSKQIQCTRCPIIENLYPRFLESFVERRYGSWNLLDHWSCVTCIHATQQPIRGQDKNLWPIGDKYSWSGRGGPCWALE